MADRYHSDTRERLETITYTPGLQDTGDLEPATNTVTAAAEASGESNADYSAALTLAQPDDARLAVRNLAARLQVTVDSLNESCAHLYCRVYVDQQDADHRLLDLDLTETGDRYGGSVMNGNEMATLFDLIPDGAAHTFYFFLWVDTGNAVVSAVQLWHGVGNYGGTGWSEEEIIRVSHDGWLQVSGTFNLLGTGAARYMGYTPARGGAFQEAIHYHQGSTGAALDCYRMDIPQPLLCQSEYAMHIVMATVATDLWYVHSVRFVLRSEP